MKILQPMVHTYSWWAKNLSWIRGRGLILRAVDGLQRLGIAAPIVTGDEGVRLELGTDFVARSILYDHRWEPEETELLRPVTPSGGTFIGVGANIGYFSLLASRWVGPSGQVFALEPVSATHSRLRRNIALNSIANITPVQVGASSVPGTAIIALEDDAGHSHLVSADGDQGRQETIALTTVDAFVASKRLTRVDVMKIDVEGADFEVIRWAEWSIRRWSSSASTTRCRTFVTR